MSEELSPLYFQALERATEHHASSKTYSGKFLRPHAPFIKALIDKHRARAVLDYGCGKGVQYMWRANAEPGQAIPAGLTIEEYWRVPVTRYDPAYPPFADEPRGVYGVVIVTHVLGSIPIVDLPKILRRIYAYSVGAVYVAEKIGPIGKEVLTDLPNMPHGWTRTQWVKALREARGDRSLEIILATRERTPRGIITERASI